MSLLEAKGLINWIISTKIVSKVVFSHYLFIKPQFLPLRADNICRQKFRLLFEKGEGSPQSVKKEPYCQMKPIHNHNSLSYWYHFQSTRKLNDNTKITNNSTLEFKFY